MKSPGLEEVLTALPVASAPIGPEELVRSGPTVETIYPDEVSDPEFAFEVSYEGTYEVDERCLADGSILDEHFSAMGGWISATLVKVGDLRLDFHPPLDEPE